MKRWLAPVSVSAVLIAAWFASWYSSVSVQKLPGIKLLHPSLDTYSRPPLASVGPGTGASSTGSQTFRWILYGMMAIAGAILLVLAGFLIRMLLRSLDRAKPRLLVLRDRPVNAGQQRGDEAEMLAAVDAGLAELSDSDADPRRAVIACWVRLERAAAAAGTPREPGDSPTDLVARLLGAHQVSRPVLGGLARAYREARFTTHPIDQRMRHTAVEALRQLRAELANESVIDGA